MQITQICAVNSGDTVDSSSVRIQLYVIPSRYTTRIPNFGVWGGFDMDLNFSVLLVDSFQLTWYK